MVVVGTPFFKVNFLLYAEHRRVLKHFIPPLPAQNLTAARRHGATSTQRQNNWALLVRRIHLQSPARGRRGRFGSITDGKRSAVRGAIGFCLWLGSVRGRRRWRRGAETCLLCSCQKCFQGGDPEDPCEWGHPPSRRWAPPEGRRGHRLGKLAHSPLEICKSLDKGPVSL